MRATQTFGLLLAIIVASSAFSPSHATTYIRQWFDGEWRCTLNGAPGRMFWGVGKGDSSKWQGNTSCEGSECSITSEEAPYGGRFMRDDGAITYLKIFSSNKLAFYMSAPDGNLWYLEQAGQPKRLNGWVGQSNGQSTPLACWRPDLPPPGIGSQLPPRPANIGADSVATRTYPQPLGPNGLPIDYCLRFGDNASCGKEAADAFCVSQGHPNAVSQSDFVIKPSTVTVNGAICATGQCWAFLEIVCRR